MKSWHLSRTSIDWFDVWGLKGQGGNGRSDSGRPTFFSSGEAAMPVKNIQQVVAKGLCISCGACAAATPQARVEMREAPRSGMYFPESDQAPGDWGSGKEFDVCPGKGYEIARLAEGLYPESAHRDVFLGHWNSAWACRATSERIGRGAASGGIMTLLCVHLMERGVVDGAVVTGFSFGTPGPRPRTYIATTIDELLQAQGSKYCPVPADEVVAAVRGFRGRVVFVGTPCQIAGIRLLQAQDPLLKEKIPVTIGNFCGGFRDFRETDRIIRRAQHSPAQVTGFRYRGGGQPGSMRIVDERGYTTELAYPDYVRLTGVTKNRRCRLCVDGTAELADFACGDAWIPRFLESGLQWSLLLARSQYASRLIEEMRSIGALELAYVSHDEIVSSQQGNLSSKKVRQQARRKLYGTLGLSLPEFDGGYLRQTSSVALELKVFLSHSLLALLESLRIYPLLARLIGRYPREMRKRR
jgi:coenzyme F420 hydrogenase subunit beta